MQTKELVFVLLIISIPIISFFFSIKSGKIIDFVPTKETHTGPEIILKNTELSVFFKENFGDCQIKSEESRFFSYKNIAKCNEIIFILNKDDKKRQNKISISSKKSTIDLKNKALYFNKNVISQISSKSIKIT